ncbi:MAG: hypothetical protein IJH64_04815 [Oscillospiraceae bacterium]|nr:hypothetical protein [Oscillospiraceae bacterium]
MFTFTETYTISGFKATIDDLRDYLEPGPDFDLCYEDIKEFYDIGAKIYEFTVRPSSMVVTLGEVENEKMSVFLNDKRSGYIGKKKSAELERFRTLYSIKGIYPRIDCGSYKKVVHNDDYDPDIDEPEEKKWVEWFGADDKIAAKIEVVIEKGR